MHSLAVEDLTKSILNLRRKQRPLKTVSSGRISTMEGSFSWSGRILSFGLAMSKDQNQHRFYQVSAPWCSRNKIRYNYRNLRKFILPHQTLIKSFSECTTFFVLLCLGKAWLRWLMRHGLNYKIAKPVHYLTNHQLVTNLAHLDLAVDFLNR